MSTKHKHDHHISSSMFLLVVLTGLLILTALTVYTARYVELGESGNLAVALIIAILKAGLVCAFFMHLAHDKALNSVALFFCVLAVMTFLGFTMLDLGSRDALEPLRDTWTQEPTMVEDARAAAEQESHNPDPDH